MILTGWGQSQSIKPCLPISNILWTSDVQEHKSLPTAVMQQGTARWELRTVRKLPYVPRLGKPLFNLLHDA